MDEHEIAERAAWQNGLEVVEMTQAEVDALLEYSTTLPTGKTIGKRWKRYLAAGPKAGHWVLCEYVANPDPGYVGITSRLIEVVGRPASGRPEFGTEEHRQYRVLFNDITLAPTARRIVFSDRHALADYLWSQGWRREVRPEDVTERDAEQAARPEGGN